jgi:hypothetical protein
LTEYEPVQSVKYSRHDQKRPPAAVQAAVLFDEMPALDQSLEADCHDLARVVGRLQRLGGQRPAGFTNLLQQSNPQRRHGEVHEVEIPEGQGEVREQVEPQIADAVRHTDLHLADTPAADGHDHQQPA